MRRRVAENKARRRWLAKSFGFRVRLLDKRQARRRRRAPGKQARRIERFGEEFARALVRNGKRFTRIVKRYFRPMRELMERGGIAIPKGDPILIPTRVFEDNDRPDRVDALIYALTAGPQKAIGGVSTSERRDTDGRSHGSDDLVSEGTEDQGLHAARDRGDL